MPAPGGYHLPMTHFCTHTVRGYELDAYGHVNNAVYLNYLEYARGEYLKAIGFDYKDAIAGGYGIWVVRIEIDYRLSARNEDVLVIETVPVERKVTYGTLRQIVRHGDETCAEALVKWAFVDLSSGRPTRIPPEFDKPGLSPDTP